MQDSAHILQQQVQQSFKDKQALRISGGQSKNFYGHDVSGERLSTTVHSGIIEYEPTELVIRARSGTPLIEIEKSLQEHQQILACEPPYFSERATIGGMIATGLSGPSRPYRAAVEDTVLGCTVLNGQAEILNFGGKVMKNVAGYDVSRLMAGSLGCLGVILDVTIKVIPATSAETSYVFNIDRKKSVAFINDIRKQGLPVTATCQKQDELKIRFSAGDKEIAGLENIFEKYYNFIEWCKSDDNSFWNKLCEHKLPFFQTNESLWRLSAPADAEINKLANSAEDLMTEWGGCLHWLKTNKQADEIFNYMAQRNGEARLFRHQNNTSPLKIFQPLSPPIMEWHKRLKKTFDPAGIFNPGKMYQEI